MSFRNCFSLKSLLVFSAALVVLMAFINVMWNANLLEEKIIELENVYGFSAIEKPSYQLIRVGDQSTDSDSTELLGSYILRVSDVGGSFLEVNFFDGKTKVVRSARTSISSLQVAITLGSLNSQVTGKPLYRTLLLFPTEPKLANEYENIFRIEYQAFFTASSDPQSGSIGDEDVILSILFHDSMYPEFNVEPIGNRSEDELIEWATKNQAKIIYCKCTKN